MSQLFNTLLDLHFHTEEEKPSSFSPVLDLRKAVFRQVQYFLDHEVLPLS